MKTRFGLIFVITILIAAALILFFWDFVREQIVVPIYYFMWLGDLYLKSLPQQVYLVGLILLCAIIGLNTLLNARRKRINLDRQPDRSGSESRYQFWARHLNNLHSSRFLRNKFAADARKLVLSILCYQEGIGESEAEAMVMNGDLSVPIAVKNLVVEKKIHASESDSTIMSRNILRLRGLFFSLEPPNDPLLNQQRTEIIDFIEHRLEINHAGNKPQSWN